MGTKINMLEYKNDSNDNFAFFTAIYIPNADSSSMQSATTNCIKSSDDTHSLQPCLVSKKTVHGFYVLSRSYLKVDARQESCADIE